MARTTIAIRYLGDGMFPLDIMITYPRQFIRHIFRAGESYDVTDIVGLEDLNRNSMFADLVSLSRPGGALFTVDIVPGASDLGGADGPGLVFTTMSRPAANTLAAGTRIWNTATNRPNYSGGPTDNNWYDSDGNNV